MNRIILAVFLIFGTSNLVSAQKHAPRLSYQFRNLPGIYPEASKRLLKVSDICKSSAKSRHYLLKS